MPGVTDPFCTEAPSPRTAIDIFAGEWSSSLPPPLEGLALGRAALFDDGRVSWGIERLGGVEGMRVLELGPLEGGHTFMLDRLGAAEVTAVEGNRRAFLRCLVVKELLGMPSARFLCGNFVPYLEGSCRSGDRWDLCLAVGVLYHQQDPARLIQLATSVSDRILLWTHYYDEDVLRTRSDLRAAFAPGVAAETAGFAHVLYRADYGSSRRLAHFCGGLGEWAHWMRRDQVLGCLEHFGFDVLATGFEDPAHPNGPAFCVAARRR